MCIIEKGRQYARLWHYDIMNIYIYIYIYIYDRIRSYVGEYVLEIQIAWDTNISYGKWIWKLCVKLKKVYVKELCKKV